MSDIPDPSMVARMLQAAVGSLGAAVIGHDAEGRILYWSEAAEAFYGYRADEMADQSLARLMEPSRAQQLPLLLRKLARGDEVRHLESRHVRKDGSAVDVLLDARHMGDILVSMVVRDDTEHRRLVMREHLLEALLDSSDAALLTQSPDGTILSWNSGAEHLYGYTADEVIGRSVEVLVPEDLRPEIASLTRKACRGKRVERFETRRLRKDGQVLEVLLHMRPVYDDVGDVAFVSVIARDVSEQRRQAAIQGHFSALVESSEDAIITKDLNAVVTSWNPAAERLYGYRAEEMIGTPIVRLAPAEHRDEVPRLTARVARGKRVDHFDTVRVRKDGTPVDVQLTLSPIRDDDGDITGVSVIARDITQRKKEERALRHFQAIIESSDDAIISLDTRGAITSWNPGAEALLGYVAADVLGQHISRCLADSEQRLVEMLQRGEVLRDVQTYLRARSGRAVEVSLVVSPIRGHDGDLVGTSVIARDVSALRAAEEMRIVGEAAVRASQAKTQFLANISHEIRTPMTSILGMAELLLQTPLVDEQRRYVRILREASTTLLGIVSDVLDLSKVEAGEVAIREEPFNLPELVESLLEVLAIRAHQKGLELNVYLSPDLAPMVVGDAQHVRQVLMNLLSNAIKFTDRGEVTLRVEPEEGAGAVRFVVSDSGIGIPQDKLAHVFQPFAQVANGERNGERGTGLGLAIVRRLVELMGGRVSVVSQLGAGSTFTVVVRFRPADDGHARPQPPKSLRGMNVLVVDDNATNRMILAELLTLGGARVTTAPDAEAALLVLADASAQGVRFPLILLDTRMPGMDGFALAERIRQDARVAEARLILMTSDPGRDDQERASSVGLDAFLVKPVRMADLFRALERLFNGETPHANRVPEPTASVPTPRQARLLVVDDNESNRFLLRQYMVGTSYQVDVASGGLEALQRARSGTYDIILMDVRMPDMDGVEATRRIREWERVHGKRPMRILALTASPMPDEARRCLEAGCDAHLTKPVARDALLTVVESLLQEQVVETGSEDGLAG